MNDELATRARSVRAAYDRLSPGDRAVLRRCRTAAEVEQEGAFWSLMGACDVPRKERSTMAYVVACFGAVTTTEGGAGSGERFAPWLRGAIYDPMIGDDELARRAVRFRRLLASRDRNELVHELRRLLHHGFQASRRPIDWGALAVDVKYWSDGVRRRWAEQFYTRASADESAPRKEGIPHE